MSDGIALEPPPPGDEEDKRQLAEALRMTAKKQSEAAARAATGGYSASLAVVIDLTIDSDDEEGDAEPTNGAAGQAGANAQHGVRIVVTEKGNVASTAVGGRAREVTPANVQTLQATASEAEVSSAADACAEAPAPVGAAVGLETSAPAGDERLRAAAEGLLEIAPALSEAGNHNSPQEMARALPKGAGTAPPSSKPPGTQSNLRLTPEEKGKLRSGGASVSPVPSALPTPNDGGNKPKNTTRTSDRRRTQTEHYSPHEPPHRLAGGTKTSRIDGAWPVSGARAAKGDSKNSNAVRCAIDRLFKKHVELARAGPKACEYGPRREDEEWMHTPCFENADPNDGYSETEFCDKAFNEFAIQVMVDKLEHKRLMRDDKCTRHVIKMQRTMLQRKQQDAQPRERIEGFRSILLYILNNAFLVPEDHGADQHTIAKDLREVIISRKSVIPNINSATDYSTCHTL